MAWILRHQAKDGSKTVERHDDGQVETLISTPASHVAVHSGPTSEARNRFNHAVAEVRRRAVRRLQEFTPQEIADGRAQISEARARNRSRKGMSKGGTRRQVASIPPKVLWQEAARNGMEAVRDQKHMRRVFSEHGLRVDRG